MKWKNIDFFAERYGWTLEYIENLPYCSYRRLIEVVNQKNKEKEHSAKKSQKKAKRRK